MGPPVVAVPLFTESLSSSHVLSPSLSLWLKAELQTQPSKSFLIAEKIHGHRGTILGCGTPAPGGP